MVVGQNELRAVIKEKLAKVEIVDVHTHLFPAAFDRILLWGIDEVLTYHYLIAEYFRYSDMEYREFFQLPKSVQAELVWETLFLKRSPVSEAQRGVLTILSKLGLDVGSRSLQTYRDYYNNLTLDEQIDTVFDLAGVKEIVMTNDPFDPEERQIWKRGIEVDPRFRSSLRIDPLLMDYAEASKVLQAEGFQVDRDFGGSSAAEVRRLLEDWIVRIKALYMAASLPPSFAVSDGSLTSRILHECVLPVCREQGIPFAMMIGVKKLVNKPLGLAGDSVGKADIRVVEELCTEYPQNKFLVTMLSRENQHELAITARKYRNLMVFGCWWFLNNPSLVQEITEMRLETLGLSFIPQHSDARVLEHLMYKWEHSKAIIGQVLVNKYAGLLDAGWPLTEDSIERDIDELFSGSFYRFLAK